MLGHTFAVLSPLESTVRPTWSLVRQVGLRERCVAVRAVNCSVSELRSGGSDTLAKVLAVARRCIEDDGADALVLACASMSHVFGDALAAALPVPVVNVLRVSVRMAEMLVGSGLTHSRVAYPHPSAPALQRVAGHE
jgi:allantoin racemase